MISISAVARLLLIDRCEGCTVLRHVNGTTLIVMPQAIGPQPSTRSLYRSKSNEHANEAHLQELISFNFITGNDFSVTDAGVEYYQNYLKSFDGR